MDTPQWQSTALAKRLVQELRQLTDHLASLSNELNQYTKAIHATQERQQQTANPPITVRFPDDVLRKSQAENDRQYSVHNSIRWATWLAFVAATIYGFIAYFQWQDSHDNFVVNQRAWIGADRPVEVNSIVLAAERGKVTYIITIKNFGNSVALSTAIWSKAISGYDVEKSAMEDSCFNAAVLSKGK